MPGVGRRTAEAVVAALQPAAADRRVPAFDPVTGEVRRVSGPLRARRGHRPVRRRPLDRGQVPGGPRLVRRRQPAAGAARARWSSWAPAVAGRGRPDRRGRRRPQPGVLRRPARRRWPSWAGTACRPRRAVPRGLRRGAGPAVRERPPAAPAAGRRAAGRRHRARAGAAARPARRAPTSSSTPACSTCTSCGPRSSRPSARAARRHRAAPDRPVLRLQVRPAGRRRPRGRLPLPAQPALGAGAAAADRPGPEPSATTCSAQPTARRSSWTAPRGCCGCWSTATCGRASATPCSPSAAPAASTAASRWPSSSPAGCPGPASTSPVVHRDLGRE